MVDWLVTLLPGLSGRLPSVAVTGRQRSHQALGLIGHNVRSQASVIYTEKIYTWQCLASP